MVTVYVVSREDVHGATVAAVYDNRGAALLHADRITARASGRYHGTVKDWIVSTAPPSPNPERPTT